MWYSNSHQENEIPAHQEAPVAISTVPVTATADSETSSNQTAEVKVSDSNAAANSAADTSNLNPAEKKQSEVLNQVFATKNDNDPRLDKDLRHLSENFKKYLTQQYNALAPEKRNEKGTIVFLIGRELSSTEDVQFLREVFTEAPCLSFASCKALPESKDPHHASEEEMSLLYPQMVALYQLEDQLKQNPKLAKDPNMHSQISQTLEQAKAFPVPRVREKAEQIQQKYGF